MPHQPPHVPPISCPTNLLTCAACPTNPVHSAGAAFAAPPTSTLAALASMALVAVAPIELLVAPLLLLDTGGAAGERACLLCLTSPPVICRCFLRGGGCGGSDPGEGKESKGSAQLYLKGSAGASLGRHQRQSGCLKGRGGLSWKWAEMHRCSAEAAEEWMGVEGRE
eukprot:scaffold287059_cov19-Tisochrysis_lutea.AAC.2